MNKRARRTLAGASVLALIALAPAPPAFAQPSAQKGGVELVRFKAAQQLYDKGDFAGALILFRDVISMTESPNARLYAARCLRELGKLPEAYEELTIAIRDADANAAKAERYVATRDAAAAERAALVSKIALLTIAIADEPPGLVLKAGERTLDPHNLRDPIALPPGAVVIEATAPSADPFRKELTIPAGSSETLAIVLRPLAAKAPPPPPKPATEKTGGAVRLAGFGVLGLGVVGWATFAVAGAMANSKYKTVYDACGGARCADSENADEIGAGRTLDTVANIGLGVGVAGALGGAAMVIFGGPKEVPVAAGASPEGAWLTYRGRF